MRIFVENINIMSVNYLYSPDGILEYAVVPIEVWDMVKMYIPQNVLDTAAIPSNSSFEPNDYFGMLAHLNLDVEQELTNMRSEWATSNI